MKHNNLFLWLLGLTVCWLASCSEEEGRVTYPYSCPEISELQFSTTDQTPAADSLLLFCEDSRPADSFVYAGSEIDDR